MLTDKAFKAIISIASKADCGLKFSHRHGSLFAAIDSWAAARLAKSGAPQICLKMLQSNGAVRACASECMSHLDTAVRLVEQTVIFSLT